MARPHRATQLALALAIVLLHVGPAAVAATWVPAPSCQAGVPCTSSNACLSSATTQVWYLPSAPRTCPAGTQQVSASYAQVIDYNQCRWTGCSIGGCDSGEYEIGSYQCWWGPYNENCCKLVTNTTLTCRQVLNCIAYPDPPSPRPPSPSPPPRPPSPPPPPPPCNWAAFTNGAWDAGTNSNNIAMAYVANVLARSIYSGRLFASDPGATVFGAAYHTRIVARLGGIATNMQYLQQSTEVALVEAPTSFMVVFRGSEQATDWFSTNLDIGWSYTTVFGPGVYVWDGFLSALMVNEQALRSLVATTYAAGTTQPRKPLWFAGHSLGAAMAVLFAHYVRTNMDIVPQGIFTFGGPNVGYSDWAAAYQPLLGSRTYIYEDVDDVVVGQPPWPYNDADTPGVRTRFTACQAAIDYNNAVNAAGRRRRAALLADAAAGPAAATPAAAAPVSQTAIAREVFRGGPKDNVGGGGGGADGGVKEVFRGGPKDNIGAASAGGGRRLLGKAAPPPRRASTSATATTTNTDSSTLPAAESPQPGAEALGSLDTLGSLHGGSTTAAGADDTTTDTAAGSGDGGAVQARGDIMGIDQHDAQASYMTTIYFCFLSATDKTKVPSVGEVAGW
ncbi:hypothetical protein HYH02_001361 [Chlamydomonas schloesseri]|uniref:Fungal lipase-type domain-containing protein n=1 Tax=Chlamydomonas schloesseri TaxID=2026947 RepID=A0A835WXW7_9CHLO|nr:hypothetical protein HYH02_001361 [Chlamydomonas schloesseri]|eukprot:KAG2454335.1 hypothetical protein HYH02_001361 [Chlamydomonas schloesseri]